MGTRRIKRKGNLHIPSVPLGSRYVSLLIIPMMSAAFSRTQLAENSSITDNNEATHR